MENVRSMEQQRNGFVPADKRNGQQDCMPLLELTLSKERKAAKIQNMTGRFSVDDGRLFFLARTRQEGGAALLCTYCAERLRPLLDLLQHEDNDILLLGSTEQGIFCVREIHAVSVRPGGAKLAAATPASLGDKQLQALIRRLLGRKTGRGNEPLFSSQNELKLLLQACGETFPESIRQWAEENFVKLSVSGLGSTDRRHILRALTYILNIDWSICPLNVPEIAEIRARLDKKFYGLETVKQQICEAAAQIRHAGSLPKWGILLSGPPGVGKTTIANAIADVLGMPKAYVELAIVRDAEALSGTSRIYDNGKPGLIVEQLYAARTANLVMVLNEIDKAGAESRNNALDVLLPLLDRLGFTDTFIEMAIPTNGIFFIATANDVDKLSRPLLDRFIQIEIPAYSPREKQSIFNRYVLPKAKEEARLEPEELTLSESAMRCLFCEYALEPGARDLERAAQKLVSNYLLLKDEQNYTSIAYSEEDLRQILGPAQTLQREFTMRPGMAFSAYSCEGRIGVYAFQASVRPARDGHGSLELINVESPRQQENCRLAYEAVNRFTGNRLSRVDVVLASTQPLFEDGRNYTGFAAWAAILSAVLGITYTPGSMFLGGVDLYSSVYSDEQAIDHYLRRLEQWGTVYGAVGLAARVYESHPDIQLRIVEAPSAPLLCELASVTRGR